MSAGVRSFTQCLAYSNDCGRSWTKYAGAARVATIEEDVRPIGAPHDPPRTECTYYGAEEQLRQGIGIGASAPAGEGGELEVDVEEGRQGEQGLASFVYHLPAEGGPSGTSGTSRTSAGREACFVRVT